MPSPAVARRAARLRDRRGRYPWRDRTAQQLRTKVATFRQRARATLRDVGIDLDAGGAEGLFLWGRLPGVADADALVRQALDAGILLAPGRLFSPTGGYADFLRFNVAMSCDPRLAAYLRSACGGATAGVNVRTLRPVRDRLY